MMEVKQATGSDLKINFNGVTICYDDYGKGKIPIIFIHGFPFDKSSWKPQMEFFKTTHRVIAYDIRGFGKSTPGREKQSITLFADDLFNFMETLEIDKAIVCGLSMGGYILLNAANRYPERFEAMVLCDTQCIADSPETKEKRLRTIEQIQVNGINDFAAGFVKNIFCNKTLNNNIELVDSVKNIILATSVKTIAAALNALANRYECCTSLKEILMPSLILCGKEDTVTPPVQSEFLHGHILNSLMNTIDNAGHMSNLEQPDEFNLHLNKFIAGMMK